MQVDKLGLPPGVIIRSVTPLPVVVQELVPMSGDAPLAVEVLDSVPSDNPLVVRADLSVDMKITIGGDGDIQGKTKSTQLPVLGL